MNDMAQHAPLQEIVVDESYFLQAAVL